MVAVTGVVAMVVATSTSMSIEILITTRTSTAIITDKRAVKAAKDSGSMTPVTAKASVTEITGLRRNIIEEQIPRLPSRESSSVAGPKAGGRSWPAKEEAARVVLAIGVEAE